MKHLYALSCGIKTFDGRVIGAGKKIRLTTAQSSCVRKVLPIEGTPYKIAIPETVPTLVGASFSIGKVSFEFKYKNFRPISVYALQPVPESWFVDLSGNVEETESLDLLDI